MTDAELKLVADHLGHNINIHYDVYRQPTSIIEKTKVARVLVAVDNGSIESFNERRDLKNIDIDGELFCLKLVLIKLALLTEFIELPSEEYELRAKTLQARMKPHGKLILKPLIYLTAHSRDDLTAVTFL